MNKIMVAFWLLPFVFATSCFAQEYKVGIYPSAPFIIESDGNVTGFDAELWEKIAKENHWESEFVVVDSFGDLLAGVEDGTFDAAISNMTINTEREQVVDFSHSYMDSGLGILVTADDTSGLFSRFISSIKSFMPVFPGILGVLILYVIFCCIVGLFLWVFDRGSKNSGIPDNFIDGYPEAVWLSHATGSTVGYGDVAPKRTLARLASVLVFFGGAILISFVTAHITSFQVVSNLEDNIKGPQDLRGKLVGTVKGTTSVSSVSEYGANPKHYNSIEKAYDALIEGEVDAVVYDKPRLSYYAINEGAGKVKLVGGIFDEQSYGIAFPQGSHLREPANLSILSFVGGKEHEELVSNYFGHQD